MNPKSNELLTTSQLAAILVGLAIGPEFLRLPGSLVETAYQDAWISAIIAIAYPLYIILIACYIATKYPSKTILDINKKYFGKIFGNILNVIFGLQFLLYIPTILSEFNLASRIFITGFLAPIKISLFCLAITAFAASKGIKAIGKTSEVIGYMIIPVFLLTLFIFREGSIGNIKPVFQTGMVQIVKTSVKTIYFYTGFEGLLLIHPFVRKNVNIVTTSLKALLFCSVIWVWTVLSTIIYLGVDVIPKSVWSFFFVYDSVNFPIINNIRYVFMFVWCLVTLRIVSIYIYQSHSVANNIIKIKTTKLYYVTIPLLLYLTNKFSDELLRQSFLDIASPIFVVFNIILLTLLALLCKFKKTKD